MPNIPPVGQAIAVALGVALAILRLLTASKPFWSLLPNKLQKALPAAFVALGLVPTALGQAKTWLDVATALVLVVGTYFTASRGDQGPPKDVGGGPRLDRVNSDPKLTSDELELGPPSLRFSSFVAIGLMLFACSGAPAKPGCDTASLTTMTAKCAAYAYACGQRGGTEPECTHECDEAFDARAERCR